MSDIIYLKAKQLKSLGRTAHTLDLTRSVKAGEDWATAEGLRERQAVWRGAMLASVLWASAGLVWAAACL